MGAKLATMQGGEEKADEEEEMIEVEANDEMEEEEEEEVVAEVKKPLKKAASTLEKGKEKVSEKGNEVKQVREIKDRKLPKNIKENPPSKGKASSSKEKAAGKKSKKWECWWGF